MARQHIWRICIAVSTIFLLTLFLYRNSAVHDAAGRVSSANQANPLPVDVKDPEGDSKKPSIEVTVPEIKKPIEENVADTAKPSTVVTATRNLVDDISNTTLGVEKIYVLSLAERTDRRDGISLQAALTNFTLNFIDGVQSDKVSEKAIPKTYQYERLRDAQIGCWRAHMNALQEIVRDGVSTALILEDDSDWDVDLKAQLRGLALSTQALTQPLKGTRDKYADTTFLSKENSTEITEIPFNDLPQTVPAVHSPYGDNWDLIWVGHCGMQMPTNASITPKGRVVNKYDATVPEKNYLWTYSEPFTLVNDYPEHTRVVHHAESGICANGYIVSQSGARKMLYEVGLKDVDEALEFLFQDFCQGLRGRRAHHCLAIQPALFNHHTDAGPLASHSNINIDKAGWQQQPRTEMTRWSVRLNIDNLLEGNELFDQMPNWKTEAQYRVEEEELEKAKLEKAELEKAELEKAELEKAELEKAELEKGVVKEVNTEIKTETKVEEIYRE